MEESENFGRNENDFKNNNLEPILTVEIQNKIENVQKEFIKFKQNVEQIKQSKNSSQDKDLIEKVKEQKKLMRNLLNDAKNLIRDDDKNLENKDIDKIINKIEGYYNQSKFPNQSFLKKNDVNDVNELENINEIKNNNLKLKYHEGIDEEEKKQKYEIYMKTKKGKQISELIKNMANEQTEIIDNIEEYVDEASQLIEKGNKEMIKNLNKSIDWKRIFIYLILIILITVSLVVIIYNFFF